MIDKSNPMFPTVSVVIPTRGRPDLVCRAVRSALDQTHSVLEVIVVIDGPDRATACALEEMQDTRVKSCPLLENVGGSEARNIGIRAARGRWIALLDDDDEWLPEKLTKQLAMRPEVDPRHCLISCQRIERRPGHSDIVAPRRLPFTNEDPSEYLFYSSDGRRHTSGPQTSSLLGTKDLFLDVPFTAGLRCHQDWDWYLRALHDPRTAAFMVDEPLYVLHVESSRPHMTDAARWRLSLNWVDSLKGLFTARAYTSFLVNDTMYRCDETGDRIRIFLTLLGRCWKSGGLRGKDLGVAVKWYLFRPSLRLRILRHAGRMLRPLRVNLVGRQKTDKATSQSEVA